MRFAVSAIIAFFAVVSGAFGEDAKLDHLAKLLKGIRQTHNAKSQYDAGPELTTVKYELRQWIESQLSPLPGQNDPQKFAGGVNARLAAHGLTCDGAGTADNACTGSFGTSSQFSARGYLGAIELSYLDFRHYLALRTGVGIRCGYDESAYIYARRGNAWRLALATEQDRYADKEYGPQNFIVIQSSPTDVAWNAPVQHPPLVLTLGVSPWCQSNWQSLHTRLWRLTSATSTPKALLDLTDTYFLGDSNARARLGPGDVLIEFSGQSIDGDQSVRPHVLHYVMHGASAERIAPVALSPEAFVDEWLIRPWHESMKWLDASDDPASLRTWYTRFHGGSEIIFGEFGVGPYRCHPNGTLWQVQFTQQAGPKNPEVSAFFLVRWMAPYRFSLVKIQKDKFPGCDIKDRIPDNIGTLFPF